MTYKEKFQNSQDRAHHQNIATKILRDMTDLRSKAEGSSSSSRRWIWELIQNAKDVHNNGKVKIAVDLILGNDPKLIFKHNGRPFTADNIRFLIEQISTKDRKKDEEGKRKTTGKFGTGFLTTHLLSEKVKIDAVAKEHGLDHRKFQLELDRTGFDLDDITDSVRKSKKTVENLDDLPSFEDYDENELNTSFEYNLEDALCIKIAEIGLADLTKCMPYTLAFVEEIESVEIKSEGVKYGWLKTHSLTDDIKLITVNKTKNDQSLCSQLVLLSKGLTTIALPVSVDRNNTFSILSIQEEIPRLFCDFPLIGSEIFPFPLIINNPHFNPTDPRDGVYLTDSLKNPQVGENKTIIKEATELYFQLLEYAAEQQWANLHLLAQINRLREAPVWISDSWFKDEVLNPIQEKLLYTKIVTTTEDSSPTSILTEDGKKHVWFPDSSKREIRDKIWELARHWFPHRLPKKEDIDIWHKLSWKDCGKLDVDQLAAFVEGCETLEKLASNIPNQNVYVWLDDFYELLKLEEKEYDSIVNTRLIFPNQNGSLCKREHLWGDAEDIDPVFKDILKLLDKDIRDELVAAELTLTFPEEKIRNRAYVVKAIAGEVIEKTADRETASHYKDALSKLLIWFQKNPGLANQLFSDLYRRKHLLYDEDIIAENMDKAEQLADLLQEYDAKDLTQLRELIEKGQSSDKGILPITQQILVSMGITSIEDWREALKDQDLAAMFAHESTPNEDLFVYVHSLIEQAKNRVIAHLKELEEYDISTIDQTAATVFAGIKKNGQDIYIIVRPAYNGEVIIYYGSEQNTLDFEYSELWIDDGTDVKKITFGHILKKAKIRKFPI
ncbi:MAG: hypothetical protein WBH03_22750 [Cyclobacteriaceae bacterium]